MMQKTWPSYIYKLFLGLVIITGLVFFINLLPFQGDVHAAEKDLQKVEVTFTSKGVPVFNTQFTIKNLQNAYNKIKSGNITSDNVNSSAWQETEQQRGVIVADTFGIGPGVQHTSEEAESILRKMLNSGADDLVNELNENSKSTSVFHYPNNVVRRYTDNDGKAVATTEVGLNGIFDNDGNLIQLLRVKHDSSNKFSVDINSSTDLFEGKITNLSNNMKANTNSYTVEFGQELTYQLTIDKSLLTQDLPLAINPQTNLVIDNVSIPFTKVPAYGDTISLQSLGITADSSINSNASLTVLKSQIQSKFYNNILWGYAVTVPKSDTSVTLTIKAHLAPEVKLNSQLQGATTDGSLIPMEFLVGDSDLSAQTNFFMNIVATTNTGSLDYSMPTVRTSGINFASVDASGKKLERKQSYILGYEKNSQKFVYGDNKWNPVNSLDNLDLSTVQTFSGGNQYYLGGSASAIPLNTKLFSFNAEENRKINESLIKFLGLGQGKNYFLYPVDSQDKGKKDLSFTVYNKDSLRSNGQRVTHTSIGEAHYEYYAINGLIPDYQAGSVEYNVTILDQNSMGTILRIIFGIGVICLLIIIVLILFVRKGR